MRGRTLIVLTVVVIALGAFVWFVERELPSTEEREERADRLIVVERDDVEGITIESEGQEVRMSRRQSGDEEQPEDVGGSDADGEWRLVSPLAARANADAVRGVLGDLVGLEKTRTLKDADPAEYGLAEPRVTVRLTSVEGEEVIAFGDALPASGDRAVSVGEGGPVFVVDGAVVDDLVKPAGDWRSRDLVVAARADIDRVRLTSRERAVLLARRGDEFWIEAPIVDLADRDATGALLTAVTGLRVETFVDDVSSPEELGLGDSAATVEIFTQDDSDPVRVRWGDVVETAAEKDGDGGQPASAPADDGADDATAPSAHYAEVGGQVVTVEADLGQHLAREPSAWRSPAWTTLSSYEIDGILLEGGAGSLDLERVDGDWKRDGETVGRAPVSELLRFITDAAAEEVRPSSEVAVDDAATTIGLTSSPPAAAEDGEAEAIEETLGLHGATDARVPATTSQREVVLLFPTGFADELAAKVEAVRDAEPIAEEGAEEEEPAASAQEPESVGVMEESGDG